MDDSFTRTSDALGSPAIARTVHHGKRRLLTVARWRHTEAECETSDGDTVTIIVNLSGNQRVEQRVDGRWRCNPCAIGAVTVVDPLTPTRFTISGSADVLQIFLPFATLDDLAGPRAAAAVRPRLQELDAEIERCALRAFVAIARQEPDDDLLMSSIAYRLAKRLVGPLPAIAGRWRGGLSRRAHRAVDQLIDERLADRAAGELSLAELARAAELSVHHFARSFRVTKGESPFAHVLRRRIELSRMELLDRRAPIAQAGERAGFSSDAYFVERFRKQFGVSPAALREAVWR